MKRKSIHYIRQLLQQESGNPPAVIAFCEIENRKVLEDLIYGTYLSKFNYRIIHEDSPDRRGIDVCLIYRKEVKVINYNYWIPQDSLKFQFKKCTLCKTSNWR